MSIKHMFPSILLITIILFSNCMSTLVFDHKPSSNTDSSQSIQRSLSSVQAKGRFYELSTIFIDNGEQLIPQFYTKYYSKADKDQIWHNQFNVGKISLTGIEATGRVDLSRLPSWVTTINFHYMNNQYAPGYIEDLEHWPPFLDELSLQQVHLPCNIDVSKIPSNARFKLNLAVMTTHKHKKMLVSGCSKDALGKKKRVISRRLY